LVKKLLFIPPILIGVAVLFFVVNGRDAPERKTAQELARTVRVITAEPIRLVPRVTGFGSVEPGQVWNAIAQVGGEVVYVHPDLENGAILPAGTEIVRISTADVDLVMSQAQANIRSAEAKLAELEVTESNTAAILEIETRSLKLLESDLKRKEALRKRGALAQAAVEQEQRETLAQRKKVQDLKNTLRLLPTQRVVQREQIAVYQAQLSSAELDRSRTRITLPFDARIADVDAEEKQFVQTGGILATVDSVDVAEVEAQIPIAQFRAMIQASAPNDLPTGFSATNLLRIVESIGLEAVVRLRAGGDVVEWPARFARTSDSVDPKTRTIGAIVAVDGAYLQATPGQRPPLIKGLFVEIEIRTRAIANSLIVPRSALHDGKLYVVDSENRLNARSVKIGLFQGDIAVVSEGVEPGDRIVVSDLIPAIEGMLLNPQSDAAVLANLKAAAAGGIAAP
jgi:multidrug efflux system membrane fusion protein